MGRRVTPFDANRLAIRYHNIWRGGPTTTELTTKFLTLDANHLEQTLEQLSNTHDYPPTIATIHTHYTNTTHNWTPPDYTDAVAPPWQRANITRDEWLRSLR